MVMNPRDSEPTMIMLARASSNLPDETVVGGSVEKKASNELVPARVAPSTGGVACSSQTPLSLKRGGGAFQNT
jgi:hypothetical protein